MALSNRARLALAAFATGLTGTNYAGIVQNDIDSQNRQKALEKAGINTGGLSLEDYAKLSGAQKNLAEIQNLQAERAFFDSRNNNTQPIVVPEYYPRIDSMSQVVGSDPVQAFNNFRSGNLIDPRTAGGLGERAPLGLRQRAAEKAIDANVALQKDDLKSIEEAQDKAAQQATAFKQFAIEFNDAFSEVSSKIPEIGDPGFEGKVTRIGAKIRGAFDEFPIASGFESRKLVLANKQARAIEGGRVTDKDRETYAKAMASVFDNPTGENVTLASGSIMDIFNAPADAQGNRADIAPLLDSLASVDNPVLNKVVDDVIRKILLQGEGGRIGVSK